MAGLRNTSLQCMLLLVMALLFSVGMESPQHASPKIGARHSPSPQRSPLKSPLITPRNATNSFSEVSHHSLPSDLAAPPSVQSPLPHNEAPDTLQ